MGHVAQEFECLWPLPALAAVLLAMGVYARRPVVIVAAAVSCCCFCVLGFDLFSEPGPLCELSFGTPLGREYRFPRLSINQADRFASRPCAAAWPLPFRKVPLVGCGTLVRVSVLPKLWETTWGNINVLLVNRTNDEGRLHMILPVSGLPVK